MFRNREAALSAMVISAVLIASFFAISFVQQALAQGKMMGPEPAGNAMMNKTAGNAMMNKTAGGNMTSSGGMMAKNMTK